MYYKVLGTSAGLTNWCIRVQGPRVGQVLPTVQAQRGLCLVSCGGLIEGSRLISLGGMAKCDDIGFGS